jgi:VanZ family protein
MTTRFPWPTAAVACLILVAVLLPGSTLPDSPGIPGFDKMVHFIMFLTLAAAAHLDYDLYGRRRLLVACAAAIAFSALTEALQLLVDGRSAEMVDMLADLAGFAAGLAARKPLASLASGLLTRLGRLDRRSPPR